MYYTLGQAAKATGVPKPRLSRAINKGQISATRTESGGYLIDPAELHRVFPPVTAKQDAIQERYTDHTPLLVRIEELTNRLSRVNRSGSAQSAVPFGSVSPRLPLQPHLRLSHHAATAQRSCFVFAS
jgi:excisionase family DNA binding protein